MALELDEAPADDELRAVGVLELDARALADAVLEGDAVASTTVGDGVLVEIAVGASVPLGVPILVGGGDEDPDDSPEALPEALVVAAMVWLALSVKGAVAVDVRDAGELPLALDEG